MKSRTVIRSARATLGPEEREEFDRLCQAVHSQSGQMIREILSSMPKKALNQQRLTELQELSLAFDLDPNISSNQSVRPYLVGLVINGEFAEALGVLEEFHDYGKDWQNLFMHGQCLANLSPVGTPQFATGLEEMVSALEKLSFRNKSSRDLETFEKRLRVLTDFSLEAAQQAFNAAFDYSGWDEIKVPPKVFAVYEADELERQQ